jgi:hypothetical protein
MLREVERECCVSHAPEGRKYTDRVDRQTDIYICIYTATTHCQVCCVTANNPGAAGEQSRLSIESHPQLSRLFFSPSKYPFSSKVLLPPLHSPPSLSPSVLFYI